MNKALLITACALAGAPCVHALDDAALAQRVHALALQASRAGAGDGLRVEVGVGRLDPRLKLAPCTDVQPYLPLGTRLWGKSRIGLRCGDAQVRWNVSLPITVDVFGPALVAATPLPAGHTLSEGDLRRAETNLSAAAAPAVTDFTLAQGRVLARPLPAGVALRGDALRARQWFAAGDTVRIVAAGRGWRIAAEGQALGAGIEGQAVRVRTESGRVVAGTAVAQRLVEVAL